MHCRENRKNIGWQHSVFFVAILCTFLLQNTNLMKFILFSSKHLSFSSLFSEIYLSILKINHKISAKKIKHKLPFGKLMLYFTYNAISDDYISMETVGV